MANFITNTIKFVTRVANITTSKAGDFNTELNRLLTNDQELDTEMVLRLSLAGGTMTGQINEAKGAVIADNATPDIFNNTDGNTIHLAGTTTITDFPDAPSAGIWRKAIFDGIRTLTHGSGITLPGSANILTAVGDFAFVFADTVSAFTVLYFRADGTPIISPNKTIEILFFPDNTSSHDNFGGVAEFGAPVLADGVSDRAGGHFTVPDDFISFISLTFFANSEGTGNARLDFAARAVAVGENVNSGGSTDSIAEASYAFVASVMKSFDVSAAMDGLTMEAGDAIGIRVQRVGGSGSDTIENTFFPYKFVLVYT